MHQRPKEGDLNTQDQKTKTTKPKTKKPPKIIKTKAPKLEILNT